MIGRSIVALFGLTLAAGAASALSSTGELPALQSRLVAQYASLPLQFEQVAPNEGETTFVAHAPGYSVAVSRTGATLAFRDAFPVDIRFVDVSDDARLKGVGDEPARIHRLRVGNTYAVAVPAFRRVAVSNLQPGLDVAFHG